MNIAELKQIEELDSKIEALQQEITRKNDEIVAPKFEEAKIQLFDAVEKHFIEQGLEVEKRVNSIGYISGTFRNLTITLSTLDRHLVLKKNNEVEYDIDLVLLPERRITSKVYSSKPSEVQLKEERIKNLEKDLEDMSIGTVGFRIDNQTVKKDIKEVMSHLFK